MTIATLVKITGTRKLMMKISEKTYDMITARLTSECKKKNFPTDRLATFSLENDDGDDCHFVMISLDKYDKQNMRKFEQLLKKDVAFQYRIKPYAFIPDGEDEQLCGINLELISIRQIKPAAIDEIDEIADQAAARAFSKKTALNAEEQAIDDDVEKRVAKRFPRVVIKNMHEADKEQIKNRVNARTAQLNKLVEAAEKAQDYDAWVEEQVTTMIARCQKETQHGKITLETRRDAERLMNEHMPNHELHRLTCFWENELPLAPPVLERQSAVTHRRRRVEPSEESLAAADYQMPEEIKAFAIIDAFEQEE